MREIEGYMCGDVEEGSGGGGGGGGGGLGIEGRVQR